MRLLTLTLALSLSLSLSLSLGLSLTLTLTLSLTLPLTLTLPLSRFDYALAMRAALLCESTYHSVNPSYANAADAVRWLGVATLVRSSYPSLNQLPMPLG